MVPITWYDDIASLAPGRLGTSGCPGTYRGLDADVASLRDSGIQSVFCLLEDHDFRTWGVPRLLDAYARARFRVHHHPIRDFGVPTIEDMTRVIDDLETALDAGSTALVHCAAGIGRTGTVTACLLVRHGLSARQAIHTVRDHRAGSLENWDQETFVYDFAALGAEAE